jgi:hypothetical protein
VCDFAIIHLEIHIGKEKCKKGKENITREKHLKLKIVTILFIQDTVACFKSQMNYTLQAGSEGYAQEH